MWCFVAFFITPSCLSSVAGNAIRNSGDQTVITRVRRQENKGFNLFDNEAPKPTANATSHDDDSGEYYQDHLDLMGWLKGPLIILGFIVVLSLCLFFMYIYKYRAESGTRRQSMVSSQLHQIRRSTIEPPSPAPTTP
jgi:hypothetical protein